MAQPAFAQDRDGFGDEWAKNHAFPLMTWIRNEPLNVAQYRSANFTSLLTTYPSHVSLAPANGWPLHFNLSSDSLTPLTLEKINTVSTPTADNGWYIFDEPGAAALPGIANIADYLRTNRPNSLIYLNVANLDETFLDNMMTTVEPDVLMYDFYPFYTGNRAIVHGPFNINEYFGALTTITSKSKQYNVPVYSWMQSFGDTASDWRAPSESELRTQAFSSLTAGVKGLAYFVYEPIYLPGGYEFDAALLKPDFTPDAQYTYVQSMNREIRNLGRSLRALENEAFRFIPGRHYTLAPFTTRNVTPTSLINFSAGAGGDPNIVSVAVTTSQSANIGLQKDGLIGLFTDDEGDHYFLLTNLYQGTALSPAASVLGFTVTFNSSINSVYRLNRLTGAPERFDLNNHILNLSLPGGTGDLFKYGDGYFAGILPGDADLDDDVDLSDLGTLAASYGLNTGRTWLNGDFDLDGDVDLSDLSVLAAHYGEGSAQAFADFQSLQMIPEPSTAGIFLFAAAGLLRRAGRTG